MHNITIVIKSWNAVEYTLLTINSIKNHTRIPHHIVVVDNGSSPESVRLLRSQNIELIELGENKGPAIAAIVGYSRSQGSYTVLMDNDIVVTPNWLPRLLQSINKDRNIALVSPLRYNSRLKHPSSDKDSRSAWESIRAKDLSPENALNQYISPYPSLEAFEAKFTALNQTRDEYLICPPDFTSSSCILVRNELINKAGGLATEEFTTYGGEDVDLCWRIGEAGYKILKSGSVYVHHFEHSSVNANKLDINSSMKKGNFLLYRKWNSKIHKITLDMLASADLESLSNRYPFIKLFKSIEQNGDGDPF